jgi:hypothetical protein
MRFSRVWFAVRWLIVAVAFVLVDVGIWVGAMKGRSILDQEMARRRAVEAEAAEAAENELESISRQASKAIKLIHDQELARRQAEEADTAKAVAKGCELRLISSAHDVSAIATQGENLIIVAAVKNVLYFRIFDRDGKTVVDTDETTLETHAGSMEDLRKQLECLWPPHELTKSEKGQVIAAVTSIGGLTTYPEIARQHSEEAAELDSLLHSGGEYNGKTIFVLFTDDYYRDSEKYRRRWQAKRDWHARMAAKYRRAALCPWEALPPDSPEPR